MELSVTIDPIRFQSPTQMKAKISSALKVFGAYYRKRVQLRFAAGGPGWPEKKDASLGEHRARQITALAEHRVEVKLLKQLRRASRTFDKGKGTAESVIRRARVVEEFKKQANNPTASPFYASDKKLEKSVRGLRERTARAEQAAASRLLGRMPNAMKSQISGAVLTVRNTIEWSETQNTGGTVGHGAKLPPRPFNYFEGIDGDVFAEITVNMMLVALS